MLPGEKFRDWIDKTASGFADRLKGWLVDPRIEHIETEVAVASLDPSKFKTKEVKELAQKLKDKLSHSPKGLADFGQDIIGGFMADIWDVIIGIILPSEMKTFEQAKASAAWLTSLIADFVILSAVLDIVGTATSATLIRNVVHICQLFVSTFGMDRYLSATVAPALATSIIPKLTQGYNAQYRTQIFDTDVAIRLWRRDPELYTKYLDDLKSSGFDDDRIEALKFVTLFYPAPADLIRWQAREVFEPEMIERYGLDSEFGAIEKEPFYKAGMTDEQILNFWRAHWEHASWMQVVEMLHRGLLTEEQVYDWFRVVEIPPFWRQHLIDTAYTWPTRVDVRRWWDMRTIDETELRRLYSGMGYRGVNLDNYVLWTKVYTDFPSLMARWSKGWITEDDVRRELTALGMPAERVETMIQEKIKPEAAARVEEGMTLTKTEIYKGVKQGFITREEGIELIMDLGKNRAEAEYLMDINVAVLAGSPETYAEFKDLTQKYRRAAGMERVEMPEEIKKAAAEVVTLTGEVEALERSIAEEKRGLIEGEPIPEAATKRLKSLQVKRNRAISTLEKAKSEYDRLVAEWRH